MVESSMSIRSLWLSLQNILAAAEGDTSLGNLPREHRRILTYLAQRAAEAGDVCIGDVTGCCDLGAPLTVSRRLRELEADNWINIVGDPKNHRRRLIELTPRAHATLDEVAERVGRDLPSVGLLRRG